jgi:hypothetical protein
MTRATTTCAIQTVIAAAVEDTWVSADGAEARLHADGNPMACPVRP